MTFLLASGFSALKATQMSKGIVSSLDMLYFIKCFFELIVFTFECVGLTSELINLAFWPTLKQVVQLRYVQFS